MPKEIRFSLLSTWLEALYEDFGWMRRASRAVDRKLIEDGLSQTILTLPLLQQQSVLLNWFDRFLSKGEVPFCIFHFCFDLIRAIWIFIFAHFYILNRK